MTDRSRANEETPKWVQTVALIRGELMTRFSDRLSMEEIASCAYAVAARDGQGGTGMVEEERSQFEKWAKGPHPRGLKFDLTRDLKGRPGYDQSDADAAWEGWQARSALEDRQEAAPEVLPVCEICGDSEYWHHRTFVGKHTDGHKFKSAAPAPEVQGTPRSLGKLIHEASAQKGEEFVVTSEEFEIMCAATPGPQAVGAPLFCGKKLRVGTPQKETPPKQCTWVDRMDFTGGIQCNFQRGHKGRHSFEKAAPVPEGVQVKEPETFEEWTVHFFYGEAETAITKLQKFAGRNAWEHAYKSGEAAGRRSAITERIAVLKEAAAAQCGFCGGRFTYDKAPRTEPEHIERVYVCNYGEVQGWAHGGGYVEYLPCDAGRIWKAIAKCAELQEKTKP